MKIYRDRRKPHPWLSVIKNLQIDLDKLIVGQNSASIHTSNQHLQKTISNWSEKTFSVQNFPLIERADHEKLFIDLFLLDQTSERDSLKCPASN